MIFTRWYSEFALFPRTRKFIKVQILYQNHTAYFTLNTLVKNWNKIISEKMGSLIKYHKLDSVSASRPGIVRLRTRQESLLARWIKILSRTVSIAYQMPRGTRSVQAGLISEEETNLKEATNTILIGRWRIQTGPWIQIRWSSWSGRMQVTTWFQITTCILGSSQQTGFKGSKETNLSYKKTGLMSTCQSSQGREVSAKI